MTEDSVQQLNQFRVPAQQLVLFSRQLTSLLQGGVPLVQALGTLREQPECPVLGQIVGDLENRVGSGFRFSAALALYPKIFGQLYVTMVRMGEMTGSLDSSLEQLSGWQERDEALRHKVVSALTYPVFVLLLASVLTLLLFYTILPSFVSIFDEMGTPLPLITQVVVLLTRMVRSPILWILVLAAIAAATTAWPRLRDNSAIRRRVFGALLRVPGLGGLLYHGTAARYCGALQVMLSTGFDLRQAAQLAAEASDNPLLEADSPFLVQSVVSGSPMSTHMSAHPEIYSKTMLHMTAAGEEASRVPEMLQRAMMFHELELQSRIDAVSAALEPLLLTGVSVIVGTILIAIFLPLYGILNNLG